MFQVMEREVLKPSLLYKAGLSFKMEGKIRNFLDKKKKKRLKEYISAKPALQEMPKTDMRRCRERQRERGRETQVQR